MIKRGWAFQKWDIRAILADEKTQTRRLMKEVLQRKNSPVDFGPPDAVCQCQADGTWIGWWGGGGDREYWQRETDDCYPHGGGFRSPYQPGDILWVREGLRRDGHPDGVQIALYSANEDGVEAPYDLRTGGPEHWCGLSLWRWDRKILPAIFMPRWAARIWVEVTNVRAQRIQEISEEDARAEGVKMLSPPGLNSVWPR